MGFESIFHDLNLTLRVFLIDLLLSGDNAVVIALACRSLPPAQMRRAMLIGTIGAIVLRIGLTSIAGFLLTLPLLKLVGGIALTAIAIKLVLDEDQEGDDPAIAARQPVGLWSAVGTVIIADVVMSVDNVVALAAAAEGSLLFLASGLLLSIPLLMFGSLFVTALLGRYPLLIRAGGALLGWLAGDIAIADPLIANWVNQQAPALVGVVPILVAVFVLVESRIIEEARATAPQLPPRRARATPAPVVVSTESVATLEIVAPTVECPGAFASVGTTPAAPMAHGSTSGSNAIADTTARPGSRWLILTAVIIVVAIIVAGVGALGSNWRDLLPKPAGLNRYACPGDTFIYYRQGVNSVRMSSATGSIEGIVQYDKINWGDYAIANKELGFQPPVEIKYSDTKSVRISGGRYVDIDCFIR